MAEQLLYLIPAAGVSAGVIAVQKGVKALCRRGLRKPPAV